MHLFWASLLDWLAGWLPDYYCMIEVTIGLAVILLARTSSPKGFHVLRRKKKRLSFVCYSFCLRFSNFPGLGDGESLLLKQLLLETIGFRER